MLHVILTILKILLWIILAILGLVLLLLLLVLFSPIKYKVDAKYHGKALVHAKISFLIATVRLMFDQESKKFEYSVRLAGIKLNLNKEKKPKKPKKTKKNKEEVQEVEQPQISEQELEVLPQEPALVQDVAEAEVNPVSEARIEEDELEAFDLFDDDLDKDVPKEQQSLFGRIKAVFITLKNKLVNIKNKVEEFSPENIESKVQGKVDKLKKTINKFTRFWNLKCTVKTRNYLKKYLIGLVKHIGPRSIKGYVRYGFGDPCKTGQVTGYLSLLPFVYSKHFSLEPDFYKKIIDGEVLLKGKIRIGYILRIVLNINIWRTILVARKIFRKNGNVKKKEV